ncbi:thiol:disulfide interchange protein DsbD [Paucidesulfovibrio gracilis DSM 16080]|uniref:Thiol:disulfide interchange protein DsbD n=1 Tax=Paucidesulfovibrio gracilis DSM 16080 TaxID=1121449 RepID=A0A1T4XDR6_9BACT|nr:cytochrome c biogenesis protein CcdA [Paucidesulfovibrio gracilis]SKA87328.1 thiol:disulfide interchange protein DsbD [Paucidesulfovibrio gracilis DSM 16080]
MKKQAVSILFFLLGVACFHPAHAQYVAPDEPFQVSFATYALSTADESTGPAHLIVLTLTPKDGWYAYAGDHPGPVGRPPQITAQTLPENTSLVPYLPPGQDKPDPFDSQRTMRVYPGSTPLFLPLPGGTDSVDRVQIRLRLSLCQDTKCRETVVNMVYPMEKLDGATLPQAQEQPWWPQYEAARQLGPQRPNQTTTMPVFAPPTDQTASPIRESDATRWNLSPRSAAPTLEVGGLITALALGLLAGLILNFMPCVLPVVSLKLSGLLAGGSLEETDKRRAFREHNIYFSLGVLSWFAFLAALLAATGMAWGEIFQSPLLVTILSAVVLALALSLFGVFTLPVVDLKLDTKTSRPEAQAFFTGVLATLLATPCSGPFLGGVLGWALWRPVYEVMLVFLCVGLGMSLPYLTMALFPGLSRHFPRPGAWTGYVERGAGFFLLATVAYLVNILPEEALTGALVLLWCTALASWLWGLGGPAASRSKRLWVRLSALLLAVVAVAWLAIPRPTTQSWVEFHPDDLQKRLGRELIVADFTADWCPTCKFLEQTVLVDQQLQRWAEEFNATFVRVDLTEDDPEAEALLRALNSRSIPLLAIFPQGEHANSPIVLRDIFTTRGIDAALKQAQNESADE